MAQQKRTRKLLRLMNKPTPGNLAAWEEALKRWRALTALVAHPIQDSSLDAETVKRKGVAMFLPKMNSANVNNITEVIIFFLYVISGFYIRL